MTYRSILRQDCFSGQTIVVTGGGSGIGRCVAHELASLGAHVVITGRRQEKLDGVLAEIAEDGGSAEARAFDIRDEEAVKAAVASIVSARGRIHGLVNNAGGQFPAPMQSISKKGFDAVVANNLTGGFLVMREVYLQAMEAAGGAIVNTAADMWRGMPGMAHSGAARAGMVNLTKTAAYEWGPAGVRVNCVAPGWVASSGMDTYDGMTRALIPTLKKHVPLGRIGVEAEVSAVICFLLSPAASFVTGVTVPIDGGSPLGSALFPIGKGRGTEPFDGFHRAVVPDVLSGKDAG
ncbi:SDR family oxidoreductase [Mesorhizobium sp. J428]|uniref:SDR family oxidoreductase n=1 Tax=Mesorhizobium sp. J428 TaxID=2898440 RepID=UPI002150B525|nr:SDR family oxidoreductase [Mesorhizobium sp. J428]MCR5855891.1 SDR family oxidoreductase [Mesorhizobium sp. J428]